jgi:hypothetical protein
MIEILLMGTAELKNNRKEFYCKNDGVSDWVMRMKQLRLLWHVLRFILMIIVSEHVQRPEDMLIFLGEYFKFVIFRTETIAENIKI